MIKYLNPEGLHKHPAYSQVVITEGTREDHLYRWSEWY
jgi:hypothetical protein